MSEKSLAIAACKACESYRMKCVFYYGGKRGAIPQFAWELQHKFKGHWSTVQGSALIFGVGIWREYIYPRNRA